MINPKSETIQTILDQPFHFVVPKYQRPYAWGKTEALEFYEDLKSCLETEDQSLFLGTLIFDISRTRDKQIVLVDGQQRLTTVLLLLIGCRELAKRLNARRIAEKIQLKIAFEDPATAEHMGPRLIASGSIRDVFERMADFGWDSKFPEKIGTKQVKRQVKRLKPVYDFFMESLRDLDQTGLSQFLTTVYQAHIVRIDIQDDTEAFSIFERTNARGLDLEASDLLKNYLFAKGVEDLEERWSEIIDNTGNGILRMLKYFYVSKRGYVARPQLYRRLKAYGQDIGPAELVKQLESFSTFYDTARNGDDKSLQKYFDLIGCETITRDEDRYKRAYFALEGLRLFRVLQVYPLIYAAIECFQRVGGAKDTALTKQLISMLEMLEKYHFVNTAVCDRMGNEVEKLYADLCEEYATSKDFRKTTERLTKGLQNLLASEEEFTTRFVELSYAPDSIPLIAYIFDRKDNFGLAPGQQVRLFNPDPKLWRRSHNIEHISPRKPKSNESEGLDPDFTDNIGNLLVVSYKTNSKLGNLTPREKIEKLKGGLAREVRGQAHVQEFLREYSQDVDSWTKDVVLKRARKLAEEAYKKVWAISPPQTQGKKSRKRMEALRV